MASQLDRVTLGEGSTAKTSKLKAVSQMLMVNIIVLLLHCLIIIHSGGTSINPSTYQWQVLH